MNPRTMHAFSCGLLVAIASSVIAQQPTQPQTGQPAKGGPNVVAVFGQSFGMDFVDGALRAGGPGYKAVFGTNGAEYTPALGELAPKNMPVRLTLSSIRRGEQILFDASSARLVQPRQDGMVASYDRGNGIIETYEARVDGLKQNFTFEQQPGGFGDLVVECQLHTELSGPHGSCNRGLDLVLPGVGGVSIGSVVGIDARQNRTDGSMNYDGRSIQFVLPSDFVSTAAYPLVLDPIIATTDLINTLPAKDPDVAFDETFDDYLVVWEHQFSQLDIDVRGQKVSTSGALVASQILITAESGNEINPSVGNVDAGSDYYVAWQDGDAPFGPWNIRGRRVDGGSGTTQSSTINITPVGSGSITPDVSGDNTAAGGSFDGCIIVYDDGTGISAIKVDVSLAAVAAGPISIVNLSSCTNPAISKSGGSDGRHLIVYERQFSNDRDVRGAVIDRDLAVIDALVSIEPNLFLDGYRPDVDGDGEQWMVVYQQSESGSSGPADIYCRRVEWDGTEATTPSPAVVVSDTATFDERDPAVGYLGTKYVAAWAEQFSGLNYDIRVVELDALTCTTCGEETFGAGGGLNIVDLNPEIATRYSARASLNGNEFVDQGMVVWMDTASSPPFEGDLVANLYEAFGGGTVNDTGGACGNGGTNSFNGPVALGNADLELQVTGAGSALTLVSIMFTDIFVSCGGCAINADAGSYLFAPAVSGNASFALPIPCDSSFIGTQLYTQWTSLLSGTSPCAILPASLELSYSNRLSVTIQP